MPPFLYCCPNTGYRVQGFTAEEVSDKDADAVVTGDVHHMQSGSPCKSSYR